MISRGILKFGIATPITLGLLFLASLSLAWGLSSISNDIDLLTLLLISWLGVSTGWILALRSVRSGVAILIAWFTSLILLVILFSSWTTELSNALSTINSILRNSIEESFISMEQFPSMINNLKDLGQSLSMPFIHLIEWSVNLLNGEAYYDTLITQVIWTIVVWLAALWTGYYMRRRNEPLFAMIPFGVILAGSLNYVHGEVYPILLYIAVTLTLIPLMHYKKRQQTWIETQTDYAEDIALDTGLVTLPIILLLLLVGTFTPNVKVNQILQFSQRIYQSYAEQAENAGELLGLETQPEISNNYTSIQAGGLPREHLLGSGPELNEQLVMIIKMDDPSIQHIVDQGVNPPNYYWRGVVYDQYTGKGWDTSPTETINFRGGESVFENLPINNQGVRLVVQDVRRIQGSGELLYSSGMTVQIDKDYQIERRINDGDVFDFFAGTIDVEEYRLESLLIQFNDGQLRTTDGEIPTWVLERYLQLPASLPTRVSTLAQDITKLAKTTYDKALAIEAYLRQFPYTLEVNKPPPDRDVADYFLFDLRQGYCDYYATAMVVLARSVGIPSRLVIGYASGKYDAENDQYLVFEANAHSWPELYLPGIGWVEFEPTGGLPLLQRLNWEISNFEINELSPTKKFVLSDFLISIIKQVNYPLIFILLMIVIVTGMWLLRDSIRSWLLPPQKSILYAFQRLRRQSASLTKPNYRGETPNEFAEKLQLRIGEIAGSHRIWEVLRTSSMEVKYLTDLYNHNTYSSHRIGKFEKERSLHVWWRLTWRIRLAKLKYNLTNIIFLVIIRRIQKFMKMDN